MKINNKGFSLIEILAVIVILGIILAMSVSAYNVYRVKTRQQAYDTMAKSAANAAEIYLMNNVITEDGWIPIEELKDENNLNSIQDPRNSDKNCTGIVIFKKVQGKNNSQLAEMQTKVKICCEKYKYMYSFEGEKKTDPVKIDNCEYDDEDEITGVYKLRFYPQGGTDCETKTIVKEQGEKWGELCTTTKDKNVFKGWNTKSDGTGTTITSNTKVGKKNINAYAIWNPLYTLTYDSEQCNPKTVTKENGTKWGKLCELRKDYYTFDGWYDGNTKITEKTVASKNIKVTPKWIPNKCTATYKPNGGKFNSGTNDTTQEVEYGSFFGDATNGMRNATEGYYNATRTNYHLPSPNVWNLTRSDGTKAILDETKRYNPEFVCVDSKLKVGNDTATLDVIWNRTTYTINYNSDGGSSCAAKTSNSGDKLGTLCTPTKNYYKFDGWYDGTTKVTADTIASKNVTLKAKWTPYTCTVTYRPNSGVFNSGASDTTQSVNYGNLLGDTTNGMRNATGGYYNATRTNYHLPSPNVWKLTRSDGTTAILDETKYYNPEFVCVDSKLKVGNDTATLDVIWNRTAYTVSYDSDGGSACTAKTVNSGEKLGTLCTPTKNYYKFDGWYDGTTKVTADTIASKNVTLKAKWTPYTCTVTYRPNSGVFNSGASDTTQSVNYGNLLGDTTNGMRNATGGYYNATRTNYHLPSPNVWKLTRSDGTTAILDETKYYNPEFVCVDSKLKVGNDTATLDVIWNRTIYTVSYDSDGGTACTSKSVNSGDKVSSLCTPTKTNNNFLGWYSGSTKITENTVVSSNLSLKAKWESTCKTYSVTYNKNGSTSLGKTSDTCQACNGTTSCTVTTPTITRSGYSILGFSPNSSAISATVGTSATLTLSSNITYYAITKKTVTASFDYNMDSDTHHDLRKITANVNKNASCDIYNTGTSCSVTTPSVGLGVDANGGNNKLLTCKWGTANPGGSLSINSSQTVKVSCTTNQSSVKLTVNSSAANDTNIWVRKKAVLDVGIQFDNQIGYCYEDKEVKWNGEWGVINNGLWIKGHCDSPNGKFCTETPTSKSRCTGNANTRVPDSGNGYMHSSLLKKS